MQNRKSDNQKPKENAQVKLNHEGSSIPDENQNQNHNTKKVSLGPNTKR